MQYNTNFLSLTSHIIPQQTILTLMRSIERMAASSCCAEKRALDDAVRRAAVELFSDGF